MPSSRCYTAADCNHNGYIDSNDIRMLNEAGLLLASVDQTLSPEVLFETSSAYTEYIDIIDQSPVSVEEENEEISKDSIEDETESESAEISFNIFEILIELIKEFFDVLFKISAI